MTPLLVYLAVHAIGYTAALAHWFYFISTMPDEDWINE